MKPYWKNHDLFPTVIFKRISWFRLGSFSKYINQKPSFLGILLLVMTSIERVFSFLIFLVFFLIFLSLSLGMTYVRSDIAIIFFLEAKNKWKKENAHFTNVITSEMIQSVARLSLSSMWQIFLGISNDESVIVFT